MDAFPITPAQTRTADLRFLASPTTSSIRSPRLKQPPGGGVKGERYIFVEQVVSERRGKGG